MKKYVEEVLVVCSLMVIFFSANVAFAGTQDQMWAEGIGYGVAAEKSVVKTSAVKDSGSVYFEGIAYKEATTQKVAVNVDAMKGNGSVHFEGIAYGDAVTKKPSKAMAIGGLDLFNLAAYTGLVPTNCAS
jgi:hypothetical protein